jgi:hypothetical protein
MVAEPTFVLETKGQYTHIVISSRTRNKPITVKSNMFYDVMPCSPVQIYQGFRRSCFLHPQGQTASQARRGAHSATELTTLETTI